MQKLFAALLATLFAAGVAVAQEKKDEAKPAMKEGKPAMEASKKTAKPAMKKKKLAKAPMKKEEKKDEVKK
jgi:hypothetical protein